MSRLPNRTKGNSVENAEEGASSDAGSLRETHQAKNPGNRFKPGQSGNPKGRPKGRKNTFTLMDEVLDATVIANVNGQQKKMPKAVAVFEVQVNKALRGDPRAAKVVLDYIHAREKRQGIEPMNVPLSEGDEEILDDLFFQLAESRGYNPEIFRRNEAPPEKSTVRTIHFGPIEPVLASEWEAKRRDRRRA